MTVETGFTTQGYETFPNLYGDSLKVVEIAEWTPEALDNKTNEYGEFLTRPNLMPRAKKMANWIMDRLLFEMGYRDGIYGESND